MSYSSIVSNNFFHIESPSNQKNSDEESLDNAMQEWLDKINTLSLKDQPTAMSLLKGLIKKTRSQISNIRTLYSSPHEIQNEISRLIKDFHVSANFFYTNSQSYYEKNELQKEDYKKIGERIRSIKLDFSSENKITRKKPSLYETFIEDRISTNTDEKITSPKSELSLSQKDSNAIPYISITGNTLEEDIHNGMTLVNATSMPFRAVGWVLGNLVQLITSSHPTAQQALADIGKMFHQAWTTSSVGKKWTEARSRIIEGFYETHKIPKSETAFFLESLETLAISGGTYGTFSLAKGAYKAANKFQASFKNKHFKPEFEYPKFDGIRFNHKTFTGVEKHRFAINTPAEGFLNYFFVKGNKKSILIYLEYIQKGKNYDYGINSGLIKGHTPYCTSKVALELIQEIGKKAGAKKFFLQFFPLNPKFHSFVAKKFPSKGDHYIHRLHLGALMGPYPVFDLTPNLKGLSLVANQIFKKSPLALGALIQTLSENSSLDNKHYDLSNESEWERLAPPFTDFSSGTFLFNLEDLD